MKHGSKRQTPIDFRFDFIFLITENRIAFDNVRVVVTERQATLHIVFDLLDLRLEVFEHVQRSAVKDIAAAHQLVQFISIQDTVYTQATRHWDLLAFTAYLFRHYEYLLYDGFADSFVLYLGKNSGIEHILQYGEIVMTTAIVMDGSYDKCHKKPQ